jgi:sulfur carrier protein ThiS
MKLMLPDKSVIELSVQGRSIETILNSQGIDPMTTLISREDEIIPEDTIPNDEDVIRVIRIAHGG